MPPPKLAESLGVKYREMQHALSEARTCSAALMQKIKLNTEVDAAQQEKHKADKLTAMADMMRVDKATNAPEALLSQHFVPDFSSTFKFKTLLYKFRKSKTDNFPGFNIEKKYKSWYVFLAAN